MPEQPSGKASIEALYRGLVAERARRPLHAGVLETARASGEGSNPLCGDRVSVQLDFDSSGAIGAVRHQTDGCAICAASSDLMAESVVGLDRAGTAHLWTRFESLLTDGVERQDEKGQQALGLLNAFADLHEYRSRRKCATLPWSALLAALNADGQR